MAATRRARGDTQQAVAVFEQWDFVQRTQPEALLAKPPATLADLI